MQGYSVFLAVIVSTNIAITAQMSPASANTGLELNQTIAAKPIKPAKPVVSAAEIPRGVS
jgi:hypothetical protein